MAVSILTDLNWQDIRHFGVLARLGTLSATARALGVTHATVARRITALEEKLGLRLFERHREGYRLTDDAAAIMHAVQAMESAVAVLTREQVKAGLSGLVRVTATPSLVDAFLLPRIGRFVEEYPGIDVELIGDSRVLSLARFETDVALRSLDPEDTDLDRERLAEIAYGAFASATWARRIADGESPELIGFDEGSTTIPEAIWMKRRFGKARYRILARTHISQALACVAGAGVAILPCYIAAGHADLEEVTPGRRPPARPLWMVTRQDHRPAPSVLAFKSFARGIFDRARPAFEQRLYEPIS